MAASTAAARASGLQGGWTPWVWETLRPQTRQRVRLWEWSQAIGTSRCKEPARCDRGPAPGPSCVRAGASWNPTEHPWRLWLTFPAPQVCQGFWASPMRRPRWSHPAQAWRGCGREQAVRRCQWTGKRRQRSTGSHTTGRGVSCHWVFNVCVATSLCLRLRERRRWVEDEQRAGCSPGKWLGPPQAGRLKSEDEDGHKEMPSRPSRAKEKPRWRSHVLLRRGTKYKARRGSRCSHQQAPAERKAAGGQPLQGPPLKGTPT